VSDAAAAPRAVGEIRAVRQGGFTITRLHRSGAAPVRALLIGSRAVVGPAGRRSDARWFAERLADRTWLRLRRGVDLDVLWELAPVLRAIRRSAGSWRLWRYDAVVVLLAVAPGGAAGRLRLAAVPRLLLAVLQRIAATSQVVVVALEPARGRATVREAALLPFRGPEGAPSPVRTVVAPADPQEGADRIADELVAAAARVPVPDDRRGDRESDDEPARLRRLGALALTGRPASPELIRLMQTARAAFDADLVAVNVIEETRAVPLAVLGGVRGTELPRRLALCSLVIGSRDVVVIGDTWQEADLAENPYLHGSPPVRFFAGYPLESVDGHRIGAFCVYDAEPRRPEEIDVELLRDLALLAEAELAVGR
jgi:GAF domain-containing protein